MRNRIVLLSSICVVMIYSSCTDGVSIEERRFYCKGDNECLSGYVCINNECVKDNVLSDIGAGICGVNEDCLFDELCVDDECKNAKPMDIQIDIDTLYIEDNFVNDLSMVEDVGVDVAFDVEDVIDIVSDTGCKNECYIPGKVMCEGEEGYRECIKVEDGCMIWSNKRYCSEPPKNYCVDSKKLRVYDTNGKCVNDRCEYGYNDKDCANGCENGLCKNCTPNCINKECGDDGCGGVCGECPKGEGCNPLYKCLSESIPEELNGRLSYVDWNYLQGLKYRYAASILEEGDKRYLYVCANIDRADRPVVTDHIVLRIGTKYQTGWEWGAESVVLYPGEKINQSDYIWDYRHVCDPKVIKGEFRYIPPGESVAKTYYYALFYTGINDEASNGGVNSLGWALAERPEGPFVKVVDPLVKGRVFWGVGQPAVTSIDGRGDVLLMYTRGEPSGTNMFFRRANLSDANNVILEEERIIPTGGLTLIDGSPDPVLHGADIVYDSLRDIFWMVRSGHPFPTDCPDFIANYIQVAFMTGVEFWSGAGRWYVLGNLKAEDIGFERLFDPGFVSSPFGTVLQPFSTLSLAVSVSHLCPNDLSTYRVLLYDTTIE